MEPLSITISGEIRSALILLFLKNSILLLALILPLTLPLTETTEALISALVLDSLPIMSWPSENILPSNFPFIFREDLNFKCRISSLILLHHI